MPLLRNFSCSLLSVRSCPVRGGKNLPHGAGSRRTLSSRRGRRSPAPWRIAITRPGSGHMTDPKKQGRTILMIAFVVLMTAPCWAQDRSAEETLQPVPRCRPRRFTSINGYDYPYESLLFRAGATQEVVPNGGNPDSYLHAVVDS